MAAAKPLVVTVESTALVQQNLAMLIRRLVVRVRMSDPEKGDKLCTQAMEYLRKTGLASPTDILREPNRRICTSIGDKCNDCNR